MIRSAQPSSHADKSCIRVNYDLRRTMQSMSIHQNNSLLATACNADIKVLKIELSTSSTSISAAPYKINEIVNFSTLSAASQHFPNLMINDLSWNPLDMSRIAIVNSLGEVKCYNFNERPQQNTKYISPSWGIPANLDTCLNKVSWSCSDVNILATAANTGFIRIFDTRQFKALVSTHRKGPKTSVRDVKFHPHQAEQFAEVSDDGSLKVWDLRNSKDPLLSVYAHTGKAYSLDWSTSSDNLLATASSDRSVKIWDTSKCDLSQHSLSKTDAEPALIETIRTHAEVGKVLWTNAGSCDYLATTTSCSDSNGHISLWDPKGGNVPVCIMRGHNKSPCITFGVLLSDPACPMFISASKESRMLVQDPRLGYYPHAHISPSVPAISSQGHLAFHRGTRGKTTLFPSASKSPNSSISGNHSPDNSSDSGVLYIGLAEFKDLDTVRLSRRGAEGSVFDPALIYLLANSYQLAQSINSKMEISTQKDSLASRSPSGNDLKALMALSGKSSVTAGAAKDMLLYNSAMKACKANYAIAQKAGLRCRASVWASVLALVPFPKTSLSLSISSELSFAPEILAEILKELLEGGDSQHFVVVCEVIRRVGILSDICERANISKIRMRQIYIAYIELLRKLKLFCQANQIIKESDDEEISKLSRKEVDIHLKCGICRKDLRRKGLDVSSATAWCSECKACVGNCSLCNKPVVGLLQWCPVCGHGGHARCMTKWFLQSSCCPSGCTHNCCDAIIMRGMKENQAESPSPRDSARPLLRKRVWLFQPNENKEISTVDD